MTPFITDVIPYIWLAPVSNVVLGVFPSPSQAARIRIAPIPRNTVQRHRRDVMC